VPRGDWESLATYLKSIGIVEADVSDLKDAVREEPKTSGDGFGKRVASWIGRMTAKSAQGAWNVTTGVASNLLARALAQYYGLPR